VEHTIDCLPRLRQSIAVSAETAGRAPRALLIIILIVILIPVWKTERKNGKQGFTASIANFRTYPSVTVRFTV